MNSSDWRSAGSLLQWCGATLLVATGTAVAGCKWNPSSDATSVETLARAPATREGADLDLDECRRYCHAHDDFGDPSLGVDPRPSPVIGCRLATFAIATDVAEAGMPAPSAARPPLGSTVLLCDYHWAGRFDMPLPGAPYGRPVANAPRLRSVPRTAPEHFHAAAYYEAASVVAFEQLIFDLEALGAPSALLRAAKRAKADEGVHTRLSIDVARSFGGPSLPAWPRLPTARRRKLRPFELALDNASAGCVSEMFGAWLQLCQASAAVDPTLRAVARRIALDEARHAALSFRIFDWLDQQLDHLERRLVSARLLDATRALLQGPELPPAVATRIGMPDRARRARFARALQDALPLVTT